MLFLASYLLFCSTSADELSCANHFPIRDSVDILKKLVAKHATLIITKDNDGVEWMNNLIIENSGGLLIDGVRYYLNDNRLPPEMTYYFDDSLVLNSVPIFVVKPSEVKLWRADFPDRTRALTKISHRCGVGQRACGMKCCYSETHLVQKGFLEIGRAGNLTASSTYTFNDVVYHLSADSNSSAWNCSYQLSYYDDLFRKGSLGVKQIMVIHYMCPESFYCCGLRCVPPPETAALQRRPREAHTLALNLDQGHLNALFTVAAAVSVVIFIVITLANQRYTAVRAAIPCRLVVCEMVDSQNSTNSLSADGQQLLHDARVA